MRAALFKHFAVIGLACAAGIAGERTIAHPEHRKARRKHIPTAELETLASEAE